MKKTPQPSVFISHGAPTVALEDSSYTRALFEFPQKLLQPSAIVVMSAHGMSERTLIRINTSLRPKLVYDFSGFSKELYAIEYPCPGSPAIATRVSQLVSTLGLTIQEQEHPGIDHGVWVPLRHLFPKADIPVVQISMPYPASPELIFKIGRALRPLREENILLLGSGGAVHNLRMIQWPGEEALDDNDWAFAFNDWLKTCISENKIDDLLNYESRAPSPRMAHPHPDHLFPLFFSMGARFDTDHTSVIVDEMAMGTLSLFSFALA